MDANSEGIPDNVAIGIPTEQPAVSLAQATFSAASKSHETRTRQPFENEAKIEQEKSCASKISALEGTTIFFPAPGDDEEPGHQQQMSKQQYCKDSDTVLSDTIPFADNRLENTGKSKPMKIEDLGKNGKKLYNISCIKHKGSLSQASGPGAYSVHTATTGAESLSNENSEDQSHSRRQAPAVSEDPPLRFWRDESNASSGSASARSPFKNSRLIDAEATLVNANINHLYPPVQVNSYGRPRRLSSSQKQHRYSFSQQQKEVESDKDSLSGIAEATALTSNGVVLLCLKSRKGYLLVLGALLMVVGLVVGLVLSLTGGKREGASIAVAPVNETVAPSLAPSGSPSSVPTRAPTMPFGPSVLPELLQQSLLDPTSPQSKAMEWMMEDPKHWSEIPLERKLQRYALVVIYYSTAGDTWVDSTSWLDHSTSECGWFMGLQGGKRPCNAATELIRLVLPSNDLKGSLPPEIELLSNIQALDLSGNQELQGSIPSALWKGDLASNLRSVDFSHTGFVGSLPADKLSSWSQLSSLKLENISSFAGGLPSELGLLSSLQELTLESIRLSGSIPSQVGDLSTLTSLNMRHCRLTEGYPTELGRLSRLEYLDLGENTMSGTIPSEIGLMTSLHLIAMDKSFLSGTIPSQVGWMRRIRTFNVFGNRLTGTIPSELFSVTSLQWLFLNQNRLRGAIPTEIGQLSQLLWLVAWENQLSGTLPTELKPNTALSLLSLATNPLTGTIPPELFTMTSLEWLFLGWSSLSGTIPTEVGLLTSLAGLKLNAASLSGTIPSQVGELHELTDLWIDSQATGLTGTLPSEIGTLKFLSDFKANNNNLNGSLPVEICELDSMETLNLSHNELSGSLPLTMGDMAQLTVLDLQDNFLTGLVPTEELASCTFLRELYLHNNSVSGELPNELCSLTALEFDCSQELCGCQCACQAGQ